jgi:hypothetical protein
MHPMTRRAFTAVVALAGALLAAGAPPALAHHTSLRVPLVSSGGAAPIRLGGTSQFELLAGRGGEIRFKLSGLTDPVTGLPLSLAGNTMRVSLVVNGVPRVEAIPFTITKGRVAQVRRRLNLTTNDAVEVRGVVLEAPGGAPFGTIGIRSTGGKLSSALVNVVSSPSPLELADSRDADVELTGRGGGRMTVRFDRITPADAPNNRVELEYSLNGGAPTVFTSAAFAIVDEFGVITSALGLGLSPSDVVQILRLEVFDANGDPFAALGVRITGGS